jgi:UDP-N-acetylmuramoyl-tripeptide--D-alanyl-D-alanine ligase
VKRISLEQIKKAVNGQWINKPLNSESISIHGVVIDSRRVENNDLYVPIVGERFDGHTFMTQAFEAGAICVLTHEPDALTKEQSGILVADTKKALGALAAFYREQFDIPFIGITGSVGKTSTKEMIAGILETNYKVHRTQGNYNNDIGLPLTLLSMEADTQIAVIELGMNHFGEIDYLASILKPTIGVITNIGVSHIENLGSKEGILKAKTEMLPHIVQDGLLILNGDDQLLQKVKKTYRRKLLSYGYEAENDCRVIKYSALDTGKQKISVSTLKGIYNINVDYPGEHILLNALGGILIAEYLEVPKTKVIQGIKGYKPAKMRLNVKEVGNVLRIIDDAYNASVDSMESALKTLMRFKQGGERSVVILGSMFEMGTYAKEGHEQVGQYVLDYKPEVCITIGIEAKWIHEWVVSHSDISTMAYYFETKGEFIAQMPHLIHEKDIVLLKASRGMAFEEINEALTRKFEDD